MQGLELSERFYEEYGRPMLEEQFADLLPYIAVGLAGSGSECFGFDDDISQDHDYEPGFCIFLPEEDIVDRRSAFLLERAYAKLPKSYMGYERQKLSPVGGNRHGVLRISDFVMEKTGTRDGILTMAEWMTIPEQSLAEMTNGKLFMDGYGEMTRIRESLSVFPREIRRKKLAGHLMNMAQSGQYNYQRCIRHKETAAAQLAVFEYVRSAMAVIFLLNDVYMPYYKWSFHALRQLPKLSLCAEVMEYLLTTDNDASAEEKYNVIEGIAADVIDELITQGLTKAVCGDLEKHAMSVNDGIQDAQLRNMHIFAAL
ncbi:MAG: DUF4037 domain-containing protein [Solobacterium sp.]|nr:DUF4037 domain-containing protein [Solobacterium sp.]